jgi:hypothetical protein
MSDRMSGGESGEGVYGAAKEATGSAAEQVRAAAPGTYDAGARAARYVGETVSEHPFLVGTAVIAFLGGILSATVSRSSNRRSDWQEQARNWRDRGSEMSDRLQSAAPDVSKVAGDAGKYVSQAMSESSVSGLLIAAAVGAFSAICSTAALEAIGRAALSARPATFAIAACPFSICERATGYCASTAEGCSRPG